MHLKWSLKIPGPALQDPDHLGGAGPESLQAEELPLVRGEDVNDHIATIHEHPAGSRCAFTPVDGQFGLLHRRGDILFQGLNQPRGVGRHHDEVVGERGQTSKVQHDDVGGKFLRGDLDDQLRDFGRFQFLASSSWPPGFSTMDSVFMPLIRV